jgi:hypothetical protein
MFEKNPKQAQDGGLAIAVFSELKGGGYQISCVMLTPRQPTIRYQSVGDRTASLICYLFSVTSFVSFL